MGTDPAQEQIQATAGLRMQIPFRRVHRNLQQKQLQPLVCRQDPAVHPTHFPFLWPARCTFRVAEVMIHKTYKYNKLRQQQQSSRRLMPQSPASRCSGRVASALLICLVQSEMFACCTEHMLRVRSAGAGRLLPLCNQLCGCCCCSPAQTQLWNPHNNFGSALSVPGAGTLEGLQFKKALVLGQP